MNQYQPDYLVSPGEVLLFELNTRGLTRRELARRTGLSLKHIGELVNSKSSIDFEVAEKLERAIGMPLQFWMNLEARYKEVLVRVQSI